MPRTRSSRARRGSDPDSEMDTEMDTELDAVRALAHAELDEEDEDEDADEVSLDEWDARPPSDELDEKWEDELRRRRSRTSPADDEAWELYWEHRKLQGDDDLDDPRSREW